MAANQIKKNVVGRAVAAHEEHIVVVNQNIDNVGCYTECQQNGEGDPHVLRFMLAMPEIIMYNAAKPEMV